MSYKDLHTLCGQRGYPIRDAGSILTTGPPAMDRIERNRALGGPDAESFAASKRPLMAALQPDCVADKEVVNQHNRWRAPIMKKSRAALPPAPVDGLDAGISAWTAHLRGISAKGLSQGDEQKYAPPFRAAQERALAARKEFAAFRPVVQSTMTRIIVGARWAFFLDSHRRRDDRECSSSDHGIPGPGFTTVTGGDGGARLPALISFAVAIPARHEKTGNLESGLRGCLSPGGPSPQRCTRTCASRIGSLARRSHLDPPRHDLRLE